MADAALLKGGVIVVVLLAALAVFDAYSNYSYAGNQATGAAVLAKSEKCTETDNGADYYTRGTISYNPDSKGNYKNTYEESCSDSTSLNEYYCDNGVARTTYFTCSKGCKDGACLSNCVLEEGKATCVVEEGQSPSVSVGGKTYEISADFVGSTWAILTVNGEVTPSLMAGKSVVLADGATLTILKLTVDNRAGGKRLVEFVITTDGAATNYPVDMSNYPFMFTAGEYFNAIIVVGDQASSAHVLAAADIAYSLVSFGATSATKLASEVADTFAQNVISIGTGCVNAVTNNIQVRFGQISGGGGRCWNGALSGEGVGAITLYDFGNGKVGMVVEGYTDNDVRRAAKVLVSYKDWQASGYLVGKGILVEATSQGGTKLSGYGWATATDQTACTDSDDELDDSDDGLDYYEKGKGTGLYGLDKQKGIIWGENSNKCSARWDTSLGYTINYDCCLDAYTSKQLNEAYCDENGLLMVVSYQCPRGCRDGICEIDDDVVIDEQQVITKNDYFVVMTPKLGERMFRYISALASTETSPKIEFQDLGTGGGVEVDYKAASGAAGTGTEDATLKFGGGTFKIWDASTDTSTNFNLRIDLNGDGKLGTTKTQACTDSDGGRNPYVKGTATGDFLFQGEVSPVKTVTDSCNGDTAVFENYCNNEGYRDGSNYYCPNGCKDGACLQSNQAAAAVKDILNDGETRTYTINEKDYEVTADSVGSTEVVFSVNGELTHFKELQADGTYKKRGLMVGEMYGLTVYGLATGGQTGGGIAIRVDKIETQDFAGGYRRVTFAIFASSQAVGPVVVNTLTLKANSFAVIALGAAFGSYYDANAVSTRSTCNPDDIFLASWVYAPTTEYDEETGEQYESAYQNVMLFDVDSDSRLAVKPKGHDYALRRLKFSEKGRATFNWSEAAGAWILNEGPECTLALAYDQEKMWENVQTVYAQPRLAKGINFVSVVPQMIGKTMEDVKGDCDLTGAYSNFGHSVPSASDALTKRSWDWWTPKHTFTQNELGLGMWLYSDNTCRLDFS